MDDPRFINFDDLTEDEENDLFDDLEIIDADFIDDELEDVVLEFVDDVNVNMPFEEAETRVRNVLEEYSMDDILVLNEVEEAEALSTLYHRGIIGLPVNIDEEDSETLEDTEAPEENED